jgi:predicted PurR-regulated permease PerM
MTTLEFFERVLIVFAIALVPVLIWYLFDVILIFIGAILIAALLRLVAEPFTRWCKLPESIALILSGIIIIVAIAGAAALFGTRITVELQDVLSRAGTAIGSLTAYLHGSKIGSLILSHVQGGSFSVSAVVSGVFTVSTSFLAAVVVTLVTGFYLAAQPELYRAGLSKLFPHRWRTSANETMDDIANALRLWLLGQLIQMLLVGLLSLVAVWLIGLPSPLALGTIAGVTEFIPYLGPIIASVPAILVAMTKDWNAVLWTVVAYLLIHQIEGNVIVPMIQRQMVFIPPAVMLLGVVAITFMFGTVAIIFAAPIAVILFVAVKKLYVRDSLGEETTIPGESV